MNKIVIQIDDEDILEIIPIYLKGRREELEILTEAAAQNDFATLREIGHKLKGSGGSFGFDRISEVGEKLESSAKAQDQPAVMQAIAELRDFLGRVAVVSK